MDWIIILLTIGVGVFSATAPEAAWEIGHMWQLEHGKPTEDAIKLTRISGILEILGGIILLCFKVVSFFN